MGRCGRLGPAPVLALVLPREPRFALGFDFGFVFCVRVRVQVWVRVRVPVRLTIG